MSGILVPKPMLGRQLPAGRARGLVGYWLFNEGSGNKVFDLSGGNTGTLTGTAPSWTAGKYGSAVLLPGADEYIDCGSNAILDDIPVKTIVIWIYLTTWGSYAFPRIMDKYGQITGLGWTLYIRRDVDSSPVETFSFVQTWNNRVNIGRWSAPANSLALNKLYQIVVVYDRGSIANNPLFYINGVSVIATETSAPDGTVDSDAGRNLIFGNISENFDINAFNGLIDLPMIYNRDLPASEIAELYLRPFAMFDRMPIELWVGATSVGAPPVGMAGAMTTNTGYWGW